MNHTSIWELIEQENKEWLKETMSSQEIDPLTTPIDFLVILACFCFPENRESIPESDQFKLPYIKSILVQHKIECQNLETLINLENSNMKYFFNNILANIRKYLTPDTELTRILRKDLDNHKEEYRNALNKIDSLVEEVQFYQDKIDQIFYTLQNDNSLFSFEVRSLINDYYDQKTKTN